ncbi:MAG: DNA polymerase IV [Syntrophothermus sp.]
MRTIFHLDLDAFFVSVERLLDPSLEGKPVIVGADPKHGRGVVAACSYEARKFGLHSAMPIATAYKLCPHGIYLHGHHREYSQYSDAVKNILEKYAPAIQQASIDEFYMDFTGTQKLYGPPLMLATLLQKAVWDEVALPCSIGIGSNKLVAKIGSDCMKPKGITYIVPGMEKEFLSPMPIETIPGVGRVTQVQLNAKGFYKIGDITKVPLEYFAASFGQSGIDLWEKAHGRGTEFLSLDHERKSISKEHTYGSDVVDRKVIEETLFNVTSKVCQGLRDEGWQACTIGIKLRYADFITLTRAKTVKATDDDKEIYNIALELFRKNYTRRVGVRLIGIHLSKLTPFAEQELLFEDEKIRRKKMFEAVNMLRSKYGYESINVGAAAK